MVGRGLLRALDHVPPAYEPSGVADSVTTPALVVRILNLSLLLSAANSAMLVALYAANGETQAAAAAAGFSLVYVAGLLEFRRHGSVRRVVLLVVAGSVVGGVAAHILLGGYLWSGGVLLWGIMLTATLALWTDARTTRTAVLGYTVLAVGLAGVKPVLRSRREAPPLVVSVVTITDVLVATCWMLGPAVVLLVARVRAERARSRRLLLNVLPETVADRLQDEPGVYARMHPACTVVFADLVGFTAHARGLAPTTLLQELNVIFTRFDALCAEHGAEKIKTIGDGYLAVCGLPKPDPDHLRHGCGLALAMQDAMTGLGASLHQPFTLRVGVHTGEVVAGVIGTAKFSYDVWGETVHLASRLESAGLPGVVTVSAAVAEQVGPGFHTRPLGLLDLKGQGPTPAFALSR